MNLSVVEAAHRLDMTPTRVRALLAADQLEGTKIGNTWIVEASSVERRIQLKQIAGHRAVRPMSPRTAWAASMLCDDPAAKTCLSPPERSRTLARLRGVSPDDVGVVYSWLARRASATFTFNVAHRDLDAVTTSPGVVCTGISAARDYNLDLNAPGQAHIYAISKAVMEQLIHDYWLIEAANGNVTVSIPAVPISGLTCAPRLICAVDLIDRAQDNRTRRTANTLINDALMSIA